MHDYQHESLQICVALAFFVREGVRLSFIVGVLMLPMHTEECLAFLERES